MGGANIDLLLIGVSHRTAPVAVRERLAVEPDATAAALVELTALSAVREAVMISTCNRVELYVAADDADRAAAGLAERARAAGRRRGRRSRRAPLSAPRRGGRPPPVPRRLQPRFAGGGRAADPRPDQAGLRRRRPARHGRRRAPGLLRGGRVSRRAARAPRDGDRAQPGLGQLGGGRVRAPGGRRLRAPHGC